MAEGGSPPLILVTGASGYVSTWLIKELLEKGEYRVRGTVRSKSNEKKVKPILDLVPDPKYPLELVEAELANEECWKAAVEGCTYVFHVASPFPPPGNVDEAKIIEEAVNGSLFVLRACSESGTVKRVVITSSVAAVSAGMNGNPSRPSNYEYTEDDWSEEAACPPYEKSKLRAERASWDFMEKLPEDKKFELAVVNPGYIQGPLLSAASGSGTAELGKVLLQRKMFALPNMRLGIVDVRDIVAGEIAAMFTPSAAGKRFLLAPSSVLFPDLARAVRAEFFPQGYDVPTSSMPKPLMWAAKFFDPTAKSVYPSLNKQHTWSSERMRNELGITPRPVEQAFIDTCYSLIEFGLVTKTPGYLGPPDKRNNQPAENTSPAEPPNDQDQPKDDAPVQDDQAKDDAPVQDDQAKDDAPGQDDQPKDDAPGQDDQPKDDAPVQDDQPKDDAPGQDDQPNDDATVKDDQPKDDAPGQESESAVSDKPIEGGQSNDD